MAKRFIGRLFIETAIETKANGLKVNKTVSDIEVDIPDHYFNDTHTPSLEEEFNKLAQPGEESEQSDQR